MRSDKQIKQRINKLEKKINLVAKHHDKYVDLYNTAKHLWKDVFSTRLYKYHSKYTELYDIWQQMTYYKKGLEWTLKAESEQQ